MGPEPPAGTTSRDTSAPDTGRSGRPRTRQLPVFGAGAHAAVGVLPTADLRERRRRRSTRKGADRPLDEVTDRGKEYAHQWESTDSAGGGPATRRIVGEPSGTRTRDPLIKSQVLYLLS